MNSNLVRDLIAILLICFSLIVLLIDYYGERKIRTLYIIVIGIIGLITSISFVIYNLKKNKYNKK